MKGFFERQWELFLNDMQEIGEFFLNAFGANETLMLSAPKAEGEKEGFFKREWNLFLQDMQDWGEMIMAAFEGEDQLLLGAPKDATVEAQPGFFKREWELFKTDLDNANSALENLFGIEKKNSVEPEYIAEPVYLKDEVDLKLESFLGEPIAELKENACGDKTQHEVLREYATFFKPYSENPEMCQAAFKKYYDRHALKMAVNEFPVDQARIIQNNVDIFIKDQEMFGEGGQFIDSRVDTVFEKAGIDEVNKMVGILSDSLTDGKNLQGERLFAEAVSYMVDNGIKVGKDKSLVAPVKKSLEAKLDEVHNNLRAHDDWNDDYQALLSQERKYLYALNRIEQYETEQRISEFESKLNELDVVV